MAGLLAGLLGVGGGLIAVPALLWAFSWQHFPVDSVMHMAIGTSLGAMIFTSASSAWAHYLRKGIYWHLFRLLLPGTIIGTILGAMLADVLNKRQLELLFGVSILTLGLYFIFIPYRKTSKEQGAKPNSYIFSAFGLCIGALSSLLGIGGGIITVPLLTLMHTPMREAISTSAAVGLVISIFGALSFTFFGWQQDFHASIPGSLGYLFLPACFVIGATSFIAAPYGAKLAYTLPTSTLKRIFGFFLLLTGLIMII